MLRSIHHKGLMVVAALFIGLGCKTIQQPVSDHPDQYFTVSLYSIGTGIDGEAKNLIEHTIRAFTKKGYDISYTTVPWGREGEIDYCFNLQKLETFAYQDFFKEISSGLKDRQVHIKEKAICRSNY